MFGLSVIFHAEGLPSWLSGKESACQIISQKRQRFDPCLVHQDPLEEEMATHSSILAWEIPWIEEPGGLQSMVSQESHTTYQLNSNNNNKLAKVELEDCDWCFL